MNKTLKFPNYQSSRELVEKIKEMYLAWFNEGKHYTLESIYIPIESRYVTQIKTEHLTKNEMIALYSTLGEWMENEYTGNSFDFPRFEDEIYDLIYDWTYEEIFKLNNHLLDEEIEELLEDDYERFMIYRDHLQSEIIGKVAVKSILK